MTLGEIGYTAYAAETGGTTFDGRDMPRWEDLPVGVVKAWAAAAAAIAAVAIPAEPDRHGTPPEPEPQAEPFGPEDTVAGGGKL